MLFDNFVLDSSLTDVTIYVTVTLVVAFIGFFGLRQGNIFMNLPNGFLPEKLTDGDQQHYSKSGLKEEHAAEIEQLLPKLMEE